MLGITDPSQEYFKDGSWGWNGTTWVKLPLVFGYYDQWVEDLGGVKAGAGTYEQDSGHVPAGEIWVLQLLSLANWTAVRGGVFLQLMGSVDYSSLAYHAGPAQYVPVIGRGPVVLGDGDYVKVRQLSCVNADVISAAVWGYKMKVS